VLAGRCASHRVAIRVPRLQTAVRDRNGYVRGYVAPGCLHRTIAVRCPELRRTGKEEILPKTARIELRAEPVVEERLRAAAGLTRQSLSSFVLDAAAERADRVIAEAATTVVPTDFFDALYASLAEPPEPNEALARTTRRRRKVVQG
jgi:uncharacterized protein (DUF1778 family)